MKALIVGAGLAGLTAAVLLKRKKWDVRVVETRNFPGGNCADYRYDGTHVHRYGPHIFHTNDMRVYNFISEFGGLTSYVHKVKASVPGAPQLLPVPYNNRTADILGRDWTDDEIRQNIFVNYSEKMWGCPWDKIPKCITDRVMLRRDDYNDGYFMDKWQGMPTHGYNTMFNQMVDVVGRQNCVFGAKPADWKGWSAWVDLVVYTGRMDEYYGYEFGSLPYRAIRFEFLTSRPHGHDSVINWCDKSPMTRTTDYGCFYDARAPLTVVGNEYPMRWESGYSCIEPSYPMRGFPEADVICAKYDSLKPISNVMLCGRLGAYKYMNMDAAVSDTMFRLETKLGRPLYA